MKTPRAVVDGGVDFGVMRSMYWIEPECGHRKFLEVGAKGSSH